MSEQATQMNQCNDIITNCLEDGLEDDITRLMMSSDNASSELLELPFGGTFIYPRKTRAEKAFFQKAFFQKICVQT